jgi:hypothetical protein
LEPLKSVIVSIYVRCAYKERTAPAEMRISEMQKAFEIEKEKRVKKTNEKRDHVLVQNTYCSEGHRSISDSGVYMMPASTTIQPEVRDRMWSYIAVSEMDRQWKDSGKTLSVSQSVIRHDGHDFGSNRRFRRRLAAVDGHMEFRMMIGVLGACNFFPQLRATKLPSTEYYRTN